MEEPIIQHKYTHDLFTFADRNYACASFRLLKYRINNSMDKYIIEDSFHIIAII